MKKVIDILRESGRLEDILLIVAKISSKNDKSYPSAYYLDSEGNYKCRVDMSIVRNQIQLWLNLITISEIKESVDLTEFGAYVEGLMDTYLHNYAVAVSHRVKFTAEESETELEIIRTWEVLNATINYFKYIECYEDGFEVPKGWKKKGE